MSTQRVNPYAPPDASQDDRTGLAFDAVIEERDYADLLPRRDFESVLYSILLILLALTTLLVLSGVIAGLFLSGWDTVVIPVGGIGLVTATGAVFIIRFTRPIRRARRKLKRFPDLLGIARGQLNESGLGISDGVRQHWFGPQQLLASRVSAAGIHVRFDQHPDRFLALTSRMFDAFSESVALRIQQAWRDASVLAMQHDVPAGLDLWYELNPLTEDAIAFRGTVKVQESLRTPQVRQNAIAESAGALVGLLTGSLGGDLVDTWIRYAALAYGAIAMVSSVRIWLRYFRGTHVQSWSQSGWFNSRELAVLCQYAGTKIPLSEMGACVDHGTTIVLTDNSGAAYYLAREHVQSDDDWAQIKDRCRECIAEAS